METIKDDWRKGQIAFNVLFAIDPGAANEIRGTELDPFYDDTRLGAFWTWLEKYSVEKRGLDIEARTWEIAAGNPILARILMEEDYDPGTWSSE